MYRINRIKYSIINKRIKKKCKTRLEYNKLTRNQKECLWCKRLYTKPIDNYFCSKKCSKCYNKEKRQVFKHNNRCHLHKHEILTYRDTCWQCYVENYERKHKPRLKKQFRLSLRGFILVPTFRTSKDSWSGKIAFENYLVMRNIKWFVYIKYYTDKYGRVIPIVVGKSGSILVNDSGSDVNFSTDIRDGKTRVFLKENGLDWYYDHISIRKCRSQWHALKIEDKICKKYKLNAS